MSQPGWGAREAIWHRNHPDPGRALMVAWLIRDNPGLTRKDVMRRLGYFQPGVWGGIRTLLGPGIYYNWSKHGWYATRQVHDRIRALEAHVGVSLPPVERSA